MRRQILAGVQDGLSYLPCQRIHLTADVERLSVFVHDCLRVGVCLYTTRDGLRRNARRLSQLDTVGHGTIWLNQYDAFGSIDAEDEDLRGEPGDQPLGEVDHPQDLTADQLIRRV